MVKTTVPRDEKRVIIYYTFDDEQGAGAPATSAQNPVPNTGADQQ